MVSYISKVIAITLCTNILIANAVTTYDVGIETPKKVELASDREARVKMILYYYTDKYGISDQNKLLTEVIRCESQFNRYAIGDNGHSRGLVQIYDDYHPDITHTQAFDEEFAVEFLVKNVSEGRGYLWSCWRNLK
jgi:hypothetical protein